MFALASRSSYGQWSNISPYSFDRLSGPLRRFGELSGRRVNRP
jgi:hypothetical protein